MAHYELQRNATRNQSTVDYSFDNIFLYENRYAQATLVNNIGEDLLAKDGYLVVRNAGSFETATVDFDTALTAGQTMIIGGLTYTSTAGTTADQLASAFSSLIVGATTGAGTATGTYSGALVGYATSVNKGSGRVVFTASTVGNKTNLAATGTGTAPTIVVVGGTSGTVNGISPATSANLADVIGVLKTDNITLVNGATAKVNYAIEGDLDSGLLVLPLGVSLDTMVGNKALKDVLTSLDFVLKNVTELSKFDN